MYSNMCVKIAVCLALVACVNSHVIKQHEVPLSANDVLLETTVMDKRDVQVISAKNEDKKVLTSKDKRVPVDVSESTTEFVPVIGNRNNIRVGTCPYGYTQQGGFCFRDDDYDY